MTKNLINIDSFHAHKKAPKQWKKRSGDARVVYDMIATFGKDLYEGGYFHPKMKLPAKHFETIICNIGRLVANEITKEQAKWNKEHPENPVTKKVLTKKKK